MSLLTKALSSQEEVMEPDEQWEFNSLFVKVTSELQIELEQEEELKKKEEEEEEEEGIRVITWYLICFCSNTGTKIQGAGQIVQLEHSYLYKYIVCTACLKNRPCCYCCEFSSVFLRVLSFPLLAFVLVFS